MLFTHEQAKAMNARGAAVLALDLHPPEPERGPRRETYDGVEVLRWPLPRAFRARPRTTLVALAQAQRDLVKIVRAEGVDLALLSFLDHRHLSLWPAYRWGGARVALNVHGVDAMPIPGRPELSLLKAGMLWRASMTFAVSPQTAALARRLAPGAQVHVAPNGVDRAKLNAAAALDREALRRDWGWSPDELVVLSVGNLVRRKGLDRLVSAHEILARRGRRFRHVIVGRGPEQPALRAQAERAGVADATSFVDARLSDLELAGAYHACDIFALASRTLARPPGMEGFGVVYAEASYLGRPVLAGRSGGVPSVVRHDETGLLVDPEGPEAAMRFADALDRLLSQPELRRRLGEAGREMARRRFDWALNAAQILSVTAP